MIAVIPILLFIMLGYFLRIYEFFVENDWKSLEKFIYYILFPSLIIHALGTADFKNIQFLNVAIALNVAQLTMFMVSFVAWFDKNMNGPKFTSIVQNNIRWNSYVALGITGTLYPEYISVVVLAIASMIPTANILSVWALLIWGKDNKENKNRDPLSGLIRNPIIIACVIGGIIQYYHIPMPDMAVSSLNMLGSAAMPLGLMAIGAGLDFEQMRATGSDRLFWVMMRLVGLPIMTLISCHVFGVTDTDIILVALITTAAPTATNAYILARKMGGDAPFMASLVGSSSLCSFFTIPAIIYLYSIFK
jgi:predicted permease